MDFSLNKEQKDIKEAAKEFARSEFDLEIALELDKEGRFPAEIWKKACDLGFIGLHFPEEYGGQGLGLLEDVLVIEEFCRQHSGIGMALALSCFGAEMVLQFGTQGQKREYLPPLATGKCRSSFAYLEWNPKGNFGAVDTIAEKNARGYRIRGNKSFVVNGTSPGLLVIISRMKGDESPDDLTAFALSKEMGQLQLTGMSKSTGMRMVPLMNVEFNNLEVPSESLLGQIGQGRRQLTKISEIMRIQASAMGIGTAQGAFDLALGYCKQREQFGRKIGSFEAIRDRLAEMATRIEMSRLLTYKAAWGLDNDQPVQGLNYMAKMITSETAVEVAKSALHCFGGYGYVIENQIEHFYRDSSMIEFIGMPGDHEKGLIADVVAGKI
ncbi:MAG: acyl-CoA dehydrogenase [Desulfobacteraceae bacterium]|nr:MAG: acyl-CoA dehydrogenase [Desulfobacteraceae bacterium]